MSKSFILDASTVASKICSDIYKTCFFSQEPGTWISPDIENLCIRKVGTNKNISGSDQRDESINNWAINQPFRAVNHVSKPSGVDPHLHVSRVLQPSQLSFGWKNTSTMALCMAIHNSEPPMKNAWLSTPMAGLYVAPYLILIQIKILVVQSHSHSLSLHMYCIIISK